MVCYHPLRGYRSRSLNEQGKRPIVFKASEGFLDRPVTLPCGQCIGCRLERSRQWAVRCYHEASLYDNNCFITLTYDDEHLPDDRSLDVRHFQKFMKRLRKKYGANIRFYHCGEYGERFGRPHYHACIFNHDFEDKVLWRKINDVPLFLSASLQQLWPLGHSSVGTVTFQSAAYVARYIMKKRLGRGSEEHYMDPETGVIRKPEYTTMSRKPGIGQPWLEKFKTDVYPDDFVIINGKKVRPPRYYDQQIELTDTESYEELKRRRVRQANKHKANNTPERLKVRETIQGHKLRRLPRSLE